MPSARKRLKSRGNQIDRLLFTRDRYCGKLTPFVGNKFDQLQSRHKFAGNFVALYLTSQILDNSFLRITEAGSKHQGLDKLSSRALLEGINAEDQTVPAAVALAIPAIEALAERVVSAMQAGGRLFYMGAGTSGRLGILDASECPPTYGVPFDKVVGLIAGGDSAIRKAVEFAEDDTQQGWRDLQAWNVNTNDVVVGIAASGSTPYVVGALQACRAAGISTGCITCNPGSPVAAEADFPVEVVVGPEFVTGSTRMKSGTAQKLVLNMLSTTVMIRLGYVKGNKMVHMQLSNNKLVDRGIRMIMQELGVDEKTAADWLAEFGQVHQVLAAKKQD